MAFLRGGMDGGGEHSTEKPLVRHAEMVVAGAETVTAGPKAVTAEAEAVD